MVGDAVQYIFEPVVWLDAMHLASAKQRVEHTTAFRSFMRTGKQIIFSVDIL
jgi:hypothetical protein